MWACVNGKWPASFMSQLFILPTHWQCISVVSMAITKSEVQWGDKKSEHGKATLYKCNPNTPHPGLGWFANYNSQNDITTYEKEGLGHGNQKTWRFSLYHNVITRRGKPPSPTKGLPQLPDFLWIGYGHWQFAKTVAWLRTKQPPIVLYQ